MRRSRQSRIYIISASIGLAILIYMYYEGILLLGILGLVLGFVAGTLLDASAREKSIADNIAIGIFFAGILAYIDAYAGIYILAKDLLGVGYILAMITLAILTLAAAMVDELHVGRVTRIPVVPTILILLALFTLFSAVSTNDRISYTRTSHFGGSRSSGVDAARRYNSTYTIVATYSPMPVLNGTKSITINAPFTDAILDIIEPAIYRASNTTRVRRAGEFEADITLSPQLEVVSAYLLAIKVGATYHTVKLSISGNDTVIHVEANLTSIDTYKMNYADFVMLKLDIKDTVVSSITINILNMHIAGERILNKTLAYAALALEALAAILAIPEDAISKVKRRRVG